MAAPPVELANGSPGYGTAAPTITANGATNGRAANDKSSDGADVDKGAKPAQKRKRAGEAAVASPGVSTAATADFQTVAQPDAEKPSKKSKAKGSASAAPNGVAADGSDQSGHKRQRARPEVVSPADAGPAVQVVSDSKTQPGEKARKKGKKDSQKTALRTNAVLNGKVAAQEAGAELVSTKTPMQNGEAGRSKVAGKGSEQQGAGADTAAPVVVEPDGAGPTQDASEGVLREVSQPAAAVEQMIAAGQTPPKSQLRKLRKELKAAQARSNPDRDRRCTGLPPGFARRTLN